MRMGNPSVRRWVTKSQQGDMGAEIQPATYKGVYGKAALFAFITIITAIVAELAVFTMMKADLEGTLLWVGIANVFYYCFCSFYRQGFRDNIFRASRRTVRLFCTVCGYFGSARNFDCGANRHGYSVSYFPCCKQAFGSAHKQQIYARMYGCVFQHYRCGTYNVAAYCRRSV